MAETIAVELGAIASIKEKLFTFAGDQRNNIDDFTCRRLVKRMEHFVENPTTESRNISDYVPFSYSTTCGEFRNFVREINATKPTVQVAVSDMLLDKNIGIETINEKVTRINPVIGYDSLIYRLD